MHKEGGTTVETAVEARPGFLDRPTLAGGSRPEYPHPEPKDERDDDEDGIEGEPSGQKHRRDSLALDQ
jgi:hypothetical protein